MFRKFKKTRLAFALTAAVAGGVASTNTQAVQLAKDGLGDAAIFQYYSAQDSWQTFFRIINTNSGRATAVKVRFREAANSREVLDFVVLLSPGDMWTAWTDGNPLGNGVPGIKTNDTSCLMPLQDTNTTTEGFKTIGGDLKGANFQSRAFTGDYADNGVPSVAARLAEGHMEVIGVSSWDTNGDSRERDMVQNISHNNATGHPNDCQGAISLFRSSISASSADPVNNDLAFNAYMINVSTGQGAGYNPAVMANFTDRSLHNEVKLSDQLVDMDSAQPFSTMLQNGAGASITTLFNAGGLATHQTQADGTTVITPGAPLTYNMDINNDGDLADTISVDLDQSGVIDAVNANGDNEVIVEGLVPANVATALAGMSIFNGTNPHVPSVGPYSVVVGGTPGSYTPIIGTATTFGPASGRQKYAGILGAIPVTGGVDAVSSLFMHRSVINEWAAQTNPTGVINDYFTQWVLTFPTKHYYVDLAIDINPADDVSPTLVDPDPAVNNAISPFSYEFDDAQPVGNTAGMSCEPYAMTIYNREERLVDFTSPAPSAPEALCYETNVVSFNERYVGRGFNSQFGITIDTTFLPTNFDGTTATKGWAEMRFTGVPANTIGIQGIRIPNDPAIPAFPASFFGLPVDGFMLTVYNTQSSTNNHTTINEHKYR